MGKNGVWWPKSRSGQKIRGRRSEEVGGGRRLCESRWRKRWRKNRHEGVGEQEGRGLLKKRVVLT